MDKNMDRPIEDMRLAQIGFLVNDIEKTKKEFARFFGVEEPETVNSGEYEITHTEYRGEPAPKAKCYMTFFYFGDLQMELIQPNEEPSIWREHLEQFGEGHHRRPDRDPRQMAVPHPGDGTASEAGSLSEKRSVAQGYYGYGHGYRLHSRHQRQG